MPGNVWIYAVHLLDKFLVLCWTRAGNYAGIMFGVVIMRLDFGHGWLMWTLKLLHWLLSLQQVVRLSVQKCGHQGVAFYFWFASACVVKSCSCQLSCFRLDFCSVVSCKELLLLVRSIGYWWSLGNQFYVSFIWARNLVVSVISILYIMGKTRSWNAELEFISWCQKRDTYEVAFL